MFNSEFLNNMNSEINGNNNYVNQDMEVDINMNNNPNNFIPQNTEGVQERVINRTFVHEVPQDCFFMIEKIEKYSYLKNVN